MKTKSITIKRSEIEREQIIDESPDLSFIGEYSDTCKPNAIDRQEQGDWSSREFRYFIPAMTGEETGNPDSPEQDYRRMESLNRGDWCMIGIRAAVTIQIPSKQGGYWTLQRISSPGLWGTESDSDDSYLQSVFEDECAVLAEMLEALHVRIVED